MARPKQKLRGSVMQNNPGRKPAQDDDAPSPWLGFGARLALLVIGACFIIIAGAWILKSGWPEKQESRVMQAALHLTKKASFAIKDIAVEGRHYTEKNDLYAALGANSSMAILAFDPEEAAAHVRALPWVDDVVIERRLPDSIFVRLTERVPTARWQHQNRTVVIDKAGKELTGASLEEFEKLPLVVGPDAPANAFDLLLALKSYPEIEAVLKAASRVGSRRWDLYLQPKVVARLPEDSIDSALKKLSTLIKEQKILDRAIVTIDLRVPDRLVIEPAAEPAPDNKEPHR